MGRADQGLEPRVIPLFSPDSQTLPRIPWCTSDSLTLPWNSWCTPDSPAAHVAVHGAHLTSLTVPCSPCCCPPDVPDSPLQSMVHTWLPWQSRSGSDLVLSAWQSVLFFRSGTCSKLMYLLYNYVIYSNSNFIESLLVIPFTPLWLKSSRPKES